MTINIKHGGTYKPEYGVWGNMLSRCRNKNDTNYKNYGGRGIKVCDRWLKFENFYEDMGERPKGGRYSIDRIDNDKDYEPSNCRWTTQTEQGRNMRRNVNLSYNGETLTLAGWADKLGISKATIYSRWGYGWSTEKIITTPVDIRCRKKSNQARKLLS